MKAMADASYKLEGSANYITFCSYKYMEALSEGAYVVVDKEKESVKADPNEVSDPINNVYKMYTYVGLNGDKNQMIFLPHEDLDNISIYVNTQNI